MTDASADTSLLPPYATGRPQRGVVGSSRYAQRLRQELIKAAKEPENRTLMIRGEPGLGKDNLAALVHFGSSKKHRLLVKLQPATSRGSPPDEHASLATAGRRWLYAALPLVWALLLARHLPVGMLEGGTLLPVGWPSWSADPHVVGFCQTVLMAIGWIGAVVLIRRLIVPERFNRMLGSMVMMVLSFAGRWLVSL